MEKIAIKIFWALCAIADCPHSCGGGGIAKVEDVQRVHRRTRVEARKQPLFVVLARCVHTASHAVGRDMVETLTAPRKRRRRERQTWNESTPVMAPQ
jgi:hypothetical protein